MDMAAKPRETYDIAETAVKWGAALDRLRAEQKPGVKSGRGGKAAVLQAVRDRLKALASEGYTTGQLADALREVSPRMVRTALREAARKGTKPGKRRGGRQTRVGAAGSGDGRPTRPVTEPALADRQPGAAGPVNVPDGGASAVPALDAHAPAAVPAAQPGASPPSAGLTPELRAQHRIPEWADGSDLCPGEDLAAYARRKRVQGDPNRDLSMFIGEGNRGR